MTDIEVAIAAAEAGATVLRHRFGELFARLDKGAGDAMLAVLRQACPHDVVVAEESGRTRSPGGTRRWLLDPLCGTLNYVARMRVAAVNVALRDAERFLAAAVADPFNHEVYWTDMSPAFVRSACRDVRLAGDAKFTASFRPRVVSTSLALAWVATGQRAAYITDGDLRDSVNFSAGMALCQAAGCVVTDLLGFPPWHGVKGLLAAANPETHAALLGIVRTIWPDASTLGA
jgi:myo-inositol-1(or 4)-monophosphatase